MNTREAYAALASGRKIKDCCGTVCVLNEVGMLLVDGEEAVMPLDPLGAPYYVHEEPATDEELVAEMELMAAKECWNSPTAMDRVSRCARMLRERKVRP